MSDICDNWCSFLSSFPPSLKLNTSNVLYTIRSMLSEQSLTSPEATLLLKCQGGCYSRRNAPGHLQPALIPYYLGHLTVFLRDVFQMVRPHTDHVFVYGKKNNLIYKFFNRKYYLKENVWQLKVPPSKRHMQIWRSKIPTSSSKPFFRENLFPSLAIKKLILNEASMQYFISCYR